MASDDIACCIVYSFRMEQLEQINIRSRTLHGSLITEDGECVVIEFCIRLNRWQAVGASLQKKWKIHSILIFSMKIRLMKVLVWLVATYGCESWTLRMNEERCFDAFEMKGLRKILQVSWTVK